MQSDKQSGLIDIHSHFLPFLDDGAANYDQCITTAEWYLRAGFETVIATPHYMPGTRWETPPAKIVDTVQQTEKMFKERKIPLTILPGMEIMLSEHICRNFNPDHFLTLGTEGLYLVEFSINSRFSPAFADGLDHLLSHAGLRFVIAHPERCRVFNENPEWLGRLVATGALTQVNIGSLLGMAGKRAQQKAVAFIAAGLVHFLASDTHAREGRMPPDRDKITTLYSMLGKEPTDRALKCNPQLVLAGKKVDPLVPDGNIDYSVQLYAQQGGCMQKLKNLFTHN